MWDEWPLSFLVALAALALGYWLGMRQGRRRERQAQAVASNLQSAVQSGAAPLAI